MCLGANESVFHLMVQCPFAQVVWKELKKVILMGLLRKMALCVEHMLFYIMIKFKIFRSNGTVEGVRG